MAKKKTLNLLERFFNKRKDKNIVVNQNKLTVFYDEYLENITGIPFEKTMISENFAFADFLHSLFTSYPEIPKRVPPGKLGFLVNGRKPQTFDTLKDGDKVELTVLDKQIKLTKDQIARIQREIETEISSLIEKYQINITFKKIKEIIFDARDLKNFHPVIDVFSEKIKDLDETNQVLNILMKAWDYFPHKFLGGACPLEKLSEFQKNSPYFEPQ